MTENAVILATDNEMNALNALKTLINALKLNSTFFNLDLNINHLVIMIEDEAYYVFFVISGQKYSIFNHTTDINFLLITPFSLTNLVLMYFFALRRQRRRDTSRQT